MKKKRDAMYPVSCLLFAFVLLGASLVLYNALIQDSYQTGEAGSVYSAGILSRKTLILRGNAKLNL